METGSTSRIPFIRTRSRLTTPAYPSRRATSPPVTDVPPPNGTTARWWRTGDLEQGHDVVVAAGADHGVGCVGEVAGPGAEQVGRGLAAGAQAAGRVVGEHVLGTQHRPQVGEHGVREVRGGDRGVRDGRRLVHAEGQLDQPPRGLGQGCGGGRVTPAVRVHLEAHVLQCDT